MKKKFWFYPLIIFGIFVISMSSCKKDDDEVLTYMITYDGNDNTSGDVPNDPASYSVGDAVTILDNSGNLEKTGFSFIGWNTEADGTGTDYSPSATLTISNANITLYAKWFRGGKLTVSISEATNFNNHTIYYTIYDSNSITGGAPSGNVLGQAKFDVVDNAGSTITGTTIVDLTEKLFENGTYYLGGIVDMNDNAPSTNYYPDSGDRYGYLLTVEISGNTTFNLLESSFSLTYQ